MHSAFVGMSRTGKSSLAIATAKGLVARGRPVFVFDPIHDPRWERTKATVIDDPFKMLHRCKTTVGGHWFWEEWGPFIKNHPEPEVRRAAPAFAWLGTTSRHLGHTQWFIAHGWQDLIHVRANCDQVFAFGQGNKSAALIAEDFARPELAQTLPRQTRGFFKWVIKADDNARQGFVAFKTGRVTWAKPLKTERLCGT